MFVTVRVPAMMEISNSLSVQEVVDRLAQEPGYGYLKINHGYWDHLGRVMSSEYWPLTDASAARADAMSPWEGMFESALHDRLRDQLMGYEYTSNPLKIHVSLIAYQGATSARCGPSFDALRWVTNLPIADSDSTLMKTAAEDGTVWDLLSRTGASTRIFVGPSYLSSATTLFHDEPTVHIEIAEFEACKAIDFTKQKLFRALEKCGGDATVYLQAGPLSVHWALALREVYPHVHWVDMGLALSVLNVDSICLLPWFRSRAPGLVASSLVGPSGHSEGRSLDSEQLARVTNGIGRLLSDSVCSPKDLEALAEAVDQLPVLLPTVIATAARRALDDGHHDLARDLAYRVSDRATRGSIRPLVMAAHVLEDLGELNSALQVATEAMSLARCEPAPALARARILARLGKSAKALDVLAELNSCFDIPVRKVASAQVSIKAGRTPPR
jgi:hypothetical protein